MKKKIIRLKESDLERLVQRIIKEEDEMDSQDSNQKLNNSK